MECSRENLLEVEISLAPVAALDEVTQAKMVKLPKPKVAYTKTGTIATCVMQMALLDHMDPRRLKLKLKTKLIVTPIYVSIVQHF